MDSLLCSYNQNSLGFWAALSYTETEWQKLYCYCRIYHSETSLLCSGFVSAVSLYRKFPTLDWIHSLQTPCNSTQLTVDLWEWNPTLAGTYGSLGVSVETGETGRGFEVMDRRGGHDKRSVALFWLVGRKFQENRRGVDRAEVE